MANETAQAPTYLDEQGNPQASVPAVAPVTVSAPATAPTYLDEQGNPKQQEVGTYPSGEAARPGDYQTQKGSPVINVITAGQKPGTITHHNPIMPLPGESFDDTMKRAVDAAKSVTPEQIKEEEEQSLMEAPGTLASAVALGATGPVVYGGAKGVSILKQAIVGGDSQILGHPENLMTPESRKAHPYWAGAMETLGNLSTPENAAMLIGSGKLSRLPGPAAKISSRLVSGGFGITMLSNAVKNVPELWDVLQGNGKYSDMSDDDRESIAKNLMFHITVDAAMGASATESGVTGKTTPLTEAGEKADILASRAAQSLVGGTKRAAGASVSSIGSMLGRTNDFDTAIKRSSKIPSKQISAHMEKIANVREDLQSILNEHGDKIEDPKGFADKIDDHIKSNEGKLQQEAGATKNSDEPVVPDITHRLSTRLDKFFDDNKGLYGDEADVAEAKKKILEGVLQSRKGEHLLEPNLFESENVRRRFNRDSKPQYTTNATPTTDAYKAGAMEAADEMRDAIDEAYAARGVKNVQQWRGKEANLIDVRDRLQDAQAKALDMGEGSVFGSLMKKIGTPSGILAVILGHAAAAPLPIGAAMLGDQIAQNLKNPNVNVSRAIEIASRRPNARTTVPVMEKANTPLHRALATHYGEILGRSAYPELEGRFMAELSAKSQRGIPLEPAEKKILDLLNDSKLQEVKAQQKAREEVKKTIPPVKNATLPEDHEPALQVQGDIPNNMGTQEVLVHELAHSVVGNERGIPMTEIRSHNHSVNARNGRLASASFDWSPFQNEDGSLNQSTLSARMPDIAATYVAGGVANDLWHGITFTKNKGLGADINALRDVMDTAGIRGVEASRMIAQATEDATEVLSRPNVREILEQHAQVREPGLDKRLHFSEDRMQQIYQDVKEGTNESTTGKSARPTGAAKRGTEGPGPGGKGQVQAGSAEGIRKEGDRGQKEKPGSAAGKPGSTEPESPAVSSAVEPEEHLLTEERQTALPHEYEMEIRKSGAAESEHETVSALSHKKAIEATLKKYPGSDVEIGQRLPRSEQQGYVVPTGKLGTMPESPSGRTPEDTIHHELGHFFVGNHHGFEADGMLSHNHADMGGRTRVSGGYTKARAAVQWDISKHLNANGRFTPETLGDDLPKYIEMYMGGIAEDEVRGLHRASNINNDPKLGSDRAAAERMLRRIGKTPEEASAIANAAIDTAKEKLTHPVTRGMIEENAPFREKGLSRQYHYSDERFKQIAAEHAKRMEEYGRQQANNRAVNEEAGIGRGQVDTGAEAEGQRAGGQVLPEERRVAEITTPESPAMAAEKEKLRIVEQIPELKARIGQSETRKDVGFFGPTPPEMGPREPSALVKLVPEIRKYPSATASKSLEEHELRNAADDFNKQHGRPPINTKPVAEDPRSSAVADSYKAAVHSPNNPDVKASYDALKRDIDEQYDMAKKLGIKMDVKDENPYGLSGTTPAHEELHNDVRNNKHLSVWGGGKPPADHPLSAIDPKTGLTYNDKFRMVHDIFGHVAERQDFSPSGEETAWNLHRQMFSPEARPALATETKGQAAYTYKYGDFPPQKAALLPAEHQVRPEDLQKKDEWHDRAAANAAAESAGAMDPHHSVRETEGIGTEILPEARLPLDHVPTAEDFRKFKERHEDLFGANSQLKIGWDNNSKVPGGHELNIAASGPGATEVARRLGQRAAFDIGKGEDIPTGGTGLQTHFPDYPLEQRLADLNKKPLPESPAMSPVGSSVPLMQNPLKVKGTGKEGRISTIDVAKALKRFTTKQLPALEQGKVEPQEQIERMAQIADDEAKYQLNQANSGKAWYTTDIAAHDKVLQEIRPELKDPAKMSLFKMGEAVLSSGQKPYGNLKAAIKNWDYYNETGEFSPMNPNTKQSWGPRGVDAYGNALQMLNRLVQEKGEKGTSDWLLNEHPVSELRPYNKDVKGVKTDPRIGAIILGEKRGPFAQNLHGIESAFTADMWVNRTWNRWMGTQEIASDGELRDSPRNNTERAIMKQSFEETAKKLNLTTSSLQAVLWYYEQSLYGAHGVPKESWNFADAARRIQKEMNEAENPSQGDLFGGAKVEPKAAGAIHAFDFLRKFAGTK